MYLAPLSCTLKNGEDDVLCVSFSQLTFFLKQTNIKTVAQKQHNPDSDSFKDRDGRLPNGIVKPT